MAKVEPLLWTLSDVVWLPRGLHHRHGLSLANISMRLTALTGWPLPCNTHTHSEAQRPNRRNEEIHKRECLCKSSPVEDDMVTHNPFFLVLPLTLAQFWNSRSVLSLHLQKKRLCWNKHWPSCWPWYRMMNELHEKPTWPPPQAARWRGRSTSQWGPVIAGIC